MEVCQRCGQSRYKSFVYDHDEMCEFYEFQNVTAPSMGWSQIDRADYGAYHGMDIVILLQTLSIPHKVFRIRSTINHGYCIFSDYATIYAIELFLDGGGYSDMTMEEYLRKMSGNDVPDML